MDYVLLADEMLMRLLKAGDVDALKELYRRYWKGCYEHAAGKVRSEVVAEELVQNVFVSLWEKRSELAVQNMGAYLYTAIKYQTITYIRSSMVREKGIRSLPVRQDHAEAESHLLLRELSEAIETAIAGLPEKSQAIFRLSRFEHRTNKEISQSMDISEKAVEYHITQSLKALKVHLREFFFLFL